MLKESTIEKKKILKIIQKEEEQEQKIKELRIKEQNEEDKIDNLQDSYNKL